MNEYNDQNYTQPENIAGGINPNANRSVNSGKTQSRAWSVAALVLGIFSILCCCSYLVAGICGILAIVTAIVSRKNLGYFDGLSIAGLIIAIFGLVFVVTGIIVDTVFAEEIEQFLNEFLEEYQNQLDEMMQQQQQGLACYP